ncbi:transposase [Mesorhizobium sp. M0140]|uniref:transposase n=1 Tax=Mesorhizobium sp. M0140 TaxID=2956893 RepID=UPI00333A9F72
MPDDERAAIQRHIRELDRLGDDLRVLDREIADRARSTKRRSITGVNLAVAAGLVAAVGDIGRFSSPQKLVSYFGLNPHVRQWGSVLPITGGIARSDAAMPGRCWWKPPGRPPKRRVRYTPSSSASGPGVPSDCCCRRDTKLAVLCRHMLTKQEDYLWA